MTAIAANIEPEAIDRLLAEIPEATRAIADYDFRLAELGVQDGSPTWLQHHVADGGIATLYTGEIKSSSPYQTVFRRILLSAYGKDSDGLYLDAHDWLIDGNLQRTRYRTNRLRPSVGSFFFQLEADNPPIVSIKIAETGSRVLIAGGVSYESELFTQMESATTALSSLFLLKTKGLLGKGPAQTGLTRKRTYPLRGVPEAA
jgi:hypothetical protein